MKENTKRDNLNLLGLKLEFYYLTKMGKLLSGRCVLGYEKFQFGHVKFKMSHRYLPLEIKPGLVH